MIYASVCSGIEAVTVAWKPLGMEAAWFSEIDPFCCSLLSQRFPNVPNLGDMTAIQERDIDGTPVDILVGGTPCQSFSVAGLRGGLSDPRGNLALRFVQLAGILRPRWIVWENVPGVLSSNKGRDFGTFLGALGQLGYGIAYRVLDAQFFGVPQRRRRVFVVGHLGDWRRAAAVLFEPESLCGDLAKSRETQPEIAGTIDASSDRRRGAGINPGMIVGTLSSRGSAGGGLGTDFECDGGLVPVAFGGNNTTGPIQVATACNAKGGSGRMDFESETLICFNAREDPAVTGSVSGSLGASSPQSQAIAFQCHGSNVGPMGTLRKGNGNVSGGVPAVAIQERAVSENISNGPGGKGYRENIAYTLEARHHVQAVQYRMAVRRLTPRECERLQGLPDDWTLITYRKKPAKDGPRYKAIGNSMAVPVLRWIGQRILEVK